VTFPVGYFQMLKIQTDRLPIMAVADVWDIALCVSLSTVSTRHAAVTDMLSVTFFLPIKWLARILAIHLV